MRAAALACGLLVLSGCAQATAAKTAPASRPWAVVVAPFDASSLPENKRWVGEGIGQIVSLGLVEHPGIVQLERRRMRAVNDADV